MMAEVSGATDSPHYAALEDNSEEDDPMLLVRQHLKDIINDPSIAVAEVRPLTILDISTSWQKVALDALMALFIGVPGLSLVCIPYIFIHYSWKKRHLLFDDAEAPFWKRMPSFLNEFTIWYIALGGALGDMLAYRTYFCQMRHGNLKLSLVLEAVQVDLVSTACYVGSVFLGRILLVNIIEVYAHVNYHKALAEDKKAMSTEAKTILEDLHAKFPEQYILSNQGFLPRSLSVVKTWTMTHAKNIKWWEKGIIYFSTMSIAVGLLWMKLTTGAQMLSKLDSDQDNSAASLSVEFLGTRVTLIYLFSAMVGAFQACNGWYRLMFTVMGAVSLIGENVNQLLLFTAMPEGVRAELWDVQNRKSLRKLLGDTKVADDELASEMAKLELGNREKLDLTKLDDIRVWWSLRKYIQVDFLDESTMMDYCSCIAIMLLLTFVLSGSLDWMVHKDVLAPGLILSAFLASVSAFVVAKVLQACIDINTFLDRDAQVLLDAEEALLVKPSDAVKEDERQNTLQLLRTISHKIENFDDKLQILGVSVTTNVRNGWLAGMLTLALDALMKILKPLIAHVDLEDVEAFVQGEISLSDLLKILSVKRAD